MRTENKNLGKELYDAVAAGDVARVKGILSDPHFSKTDLAYEEYYEEGGCSALYKSSVRGLLDIACLLVDAGAPLNVRCFNGFTPISGAADHGFYEMVKMLYDHGADPNMGSQESTADATFRARKQGHHRIANFLQRQEKLNVKNNPNQISFFEEVGDYHLEEIYHFDRLMRISVLRDKSDGRFSFQREKFADIQEDGGLQKAFNEHAKRGGKVLEQSVFPNRVIKSKSDVVLKKGRG